MIVKTDSPEDLKVDQQGDQITIRCESNCRVRVPTQARLRLDQVQGDTAIKAVDGEIEIKETHGNLALRRVGPLMIGSATYNIPGYLVAAALIGETNLAKRIVDVLGEVTPPKALVPAAGDERTRRSLAKGCHQSSATGRT